jgi:hypothetical protein
MSVAKTILDQIQAIDRRAIWAWGGKDFVNVGDGVQFKVGGMAKFKGHVLIKLNASDLYDIEFYKIRAGAVKTVAKEADVYAEDLVRIIDAVVQ